MTQIEAIIDAFHNLGGERTAREIEDWVTKKYGSRWKDYSTSMADMVPVSHGGNNSSEVPDYYRVLNRVERGRYCLIEEKDFF
ncbi:hypothetical protein [Ornithinibacillus californiensis]|uniref:hypothetical protein n=1 Tax=Ornithinibacillus californiensis TaxID=161536 RepID=UPI00064D80A1|nr:hypothetical protein [Ornithinibacillus californiensis]